MARQLQTLKDTAQKQILLALANKRFFKIDIDIQSPSVLLPEDICNRESAAIVITLGSLQLETKEKSSPTDFYDEYMLSMRSLSVFISTLKDWKTVRIEYHS